MPRRQPHPIDIYIGNRIRVRRCLLGMSEAALARKSGLSPAQLSRIETANTSIKMNKFTALADTLGVSVGSIFRGIE